MSVPPDGSAGQAVLLVVGVLDRQGADDVRTKFQVLCGYGHVGRIVLDLRAASTDGRTAALVAELRILARSCGKDVVVRDGCEPAPTRAGTVPGARP